MHLKLEIISFQKSLMGEGHTHTFDASGGSIGRSRDNSWVLPDPNRYVSSCHAVVDVADGRFRITDTSTNGLFLNGSSTALGRDQRATLSDGDRLVLGDYEIAVRVQDAGRQSPRRRLQFPSAVGREPWRRPAAAGHPRRGRAAAAPSRGWAVPRFPTEPPAPAGISMPPPSPGRRTPRRGPRPRIAASAAATGRSASRDYPHRRRSRRISTFPPLRLPPLPLPPPARLPPARRHRPARRRRPLRADAAG